MGNALFENYGPIVRLEKNRLRIIADVLQKTLKQMEHQDLSLDMVLGETLYLEKMRLRRFQSNIFTKVRVTRDRRVLGELQSGLLKQGVEADRKEMLRSITRHYLEEIACHFQPHLYRFATHAVPWGFNWLLNAASVKRFLPWGMTESLQSRIQILGDISLIQKLSKKGTLLMVPTHQSNLDSLVIGYVIYLMGMGAFSYGAGLNLFSNPVFAFFMGRLGTYTVDRLKTNSVYKLTLKNFSSRILREGVHSIFFPGGGRSRSGAIEEKMKLGLLGTGLEAELENHMEGVASPKIFVVPVVLGYHFVLEASSLIEDYLSELGKHRYMIKNEDAWQPIKLFQFFWKLFSSQSTITVKVGRPLDIFGHFVNDDGVSMGPNGTIIDSKKWLMTKGMLCKEPARDQQYTRELGRVLVQRFHRENVVLSSHLVAFSFFEALKKKYIDLDLFRFLRLSLPQRTMPFSEFLKECEIQVAKIKVLESQDLLERSLELKSLNTLQWVQNGIRQLGQLHETVVLTQSDDAIWTEDMNLLYYYRNRLSGYGLEL